MHKYRRPEMEYRYFRKQREFPRGCYQGLSWELTHVHTGMFTGRRWMWQPGLSLRTFPRYEYEGLCSAEYEYTEANNETFVCTYKS